MDTTAEAKRLPGRHESSTKHCVNTLSSLPVLARATGSDPSASRLPPAQASLQEGCHHRLHVKAYRATKPLFHASNARITDITIKITNGRRLRALCSGHCVLSLPARWMLTRRTRSPMLIHVHCPLFYHTGARCSIPVASRHQSRGAADD